jgi:hypothetical protein
MKSITLVLLGLVRCHAADGQKFTVVDANQEAGVCCVSEFFDRMMDSLERHPGYVEDPAEASLVFVRLDTLRVCMWPTLAIDGEAVTCDTEKARANAPPTGVRYNCSFCCPFGTDNFAATVRGVATQYGSDKTFVYFKNSWDNRYECNEFLYAKVTAAKLPGTVRFVGVQLQQSQLTSPESAMDTNLYPIPGINLLMPLLPDKQDMVEDPDSRWACSDRKYTASFSGCMTDPVRRKILELKGNEGYHLYDTNAFGGQDPEGYKGVLLNSMFAFAPRGDEHYSFRLTEVLAAGAIPIVIDNDYTAPYGAKDMKEWAIVVSEEDVWTVPNLLKQITPDQRCELKRNGSRIFNIAKDLESTVDGMVQALWETKAPAGASSASQPVIEAKFSAPVAGGSAQESEPFGGVPPADPDPSIDKLTSS